MTAEELLRKYQKVYGGIPSEQVWNDKEENHPCDRRQQSKWMQRILVRCLRQVDHAG